MAKKQYKNVYTILEKAKRGELDFSSSPRLYSNIQYNVRGEIIKPYLHYLDERALNRAVTKFIEEPASHNKVNELAKQHNKKLISPETLTAEMKTIWEKFPKETINDIFNINYQDIENLKFEDRTSSNKFRFKMIEKANNPIAKVVTRNNNIKSMVYTRSMIQYYLMLMAMLQQEDKAAFDDLMDNLQGIDTGNDDSQCSGKGKSQASGKGQGKGLDQQQQSQQTGSQQNNPSDTGNSSPQPGDSGTEQNPAPNNPSQDPAKSNGQDPSADQGPTQNSSNSAPGQSNGQAGTGNVKKSAQSHLDTLMNKFENQPAAQKILDEVLENAKQTTEKLEEVMTESQLNDMWDDLSGFGRTSEKALNRLNKEYLEKIAQQLKSVSINMNGIKGKIKSLLDKSMSYFSAQEKPYFENIFDAGTMDGFQDYELLHPMLRKLCSEDMNVKEIKKVGKIDIYVDCSGSMSSGCGIKGEDGHAMSRLLFAKAFAFKMKELNLLNEVFSFQNSVTHEGNTAEDILSMTDGGGTSFTSVIQSIEKLKRNAVIITDAEDSCHQYTERAFFIGVQGARFNSFNSNYQAKNQLAIFDGNKVYAVDPSGRAIVN